MRPTENTRNGTTCGVVTLYSPPDACLKNIETYIAYIDKLYIIDNTNCPDTNLHKELENRFGKTELLSYGKNLGIAAALNLAIKKGLACGYEWLLTMDQDSFFDDIQAKKFFASLTTIEKKTVAIVSPAHQKNTDDNNTCIYVRKDEVMTSGNLLNLSLTKKIGLFNEDLFIDSVDHDYCLRTNLAGFYVLQATNCFIQHQVGNCFSGSFLFGMKKKSFLIHSPKRMYFIIRNGQYIINKYQKDFPSYTKALQRHINVRISRCLRYSKNRRTYFKYIVKGLIDYKLNRFGNRVNI